LQLTFTETVYVFKILWKDGPSKGKLTLLHAQDIRLLSPVSIEAHPVIQFLERALKENKKNGAAGDIRTSKEAGKNQKLNHPDLNLPDKVPLVPDLSLRVRAPDLNVPVDMEVSDETEESNERSHK